MCTTLLYTKFSENILTKISLIFNILIPFDPYNSILISDEERRLRKLKWLCQGATLHARAGIRAWVVFCVWVSIVFPALSYSPTPKTALRELGLIAFTEVWKFPLFKIIKKDLMKVTNFSTSLVLLKIIGSFRQKLHSGFCVVFTSLKSKAPGVPRNLYILEKPQS